MDVIVWFLEKKGIDCVIVVGYLLGGVIVVSFGVCYLDKIVGLFFFFGGDLFVEWWCGLVL